MVISRVFKPQLNELAESNRFSFIVQFNEDQDIGLYQNFKVEFTCKCFFHVYNQACMRIDKNIQNILPMCCTCELGQRLCKISAHKRC